MASKLDQLRQLGGRNVAESTGAARAEGLPPGLDLAQAAGMPARLVGLAKEKGAARIPLDRIDRDPEQPRSEFDEESLTRLAESLRARGQLQPIRVRWDEGRGVYVILLGERRWRAARMAGLTELSCVIHDGHLGDDEKLAIQVVENALREDLRPVEQARAYRSLMDARSWSTRELAAELHVAQTSVVRALALLELPEAVQDSVERGELAPSVAAEVARLPDAGLQERVARAAVDEDLRRDEVAELVKAVRARRPAPAARPDPFELDLGDGTVVVVKWRKANRTTAVQALRKALREAQERERGGEVDAA
jgi:ParB family transcriptional regulator, chromosome partitioning protein